MQEKKPSTGNTYLDLLRNTKTKDVKIVLPKKRQIVEEQHHRCYICHKALSEGMCFFKEVQGPDPKSGAFSFGLRALCSSCYFDLSTGKKPNIQQQEKPEEKKESGWLN